MPTSSAIDTSLTMTDLASPASRTVAIIGGGPAGLMAAEVLSQAGLNVDLYDTMPSVGRKFLLAGVGGMNITHSEPYPAFFLSRYAERSPMIAPFCVVLVSISCASGFMRWVSRRLSAARAVFSPLT